MEHILYRGSSNKERFQQIASNNLFDFDFKDFMKLQKDYTKERYSFLVIGKTLSSDNLLRFKKKRIIKMSISEKTKSTTKLSKNKAQYYRDR